MEYPCTICNKKYSSYQSLWIHNKKFHKPININNNFLTTNNNFLTTNNNFLTTNKIKNHNCKYCNKIYTIQQSKWKHEQTCKLKSLQNNDDETTTIKNELNELKKQFATILNEKGKMHHKTLQKINNQVNNINNGKIINKVYVKFGNIDYEKILSFQQINEIISHQYKCLEAAIKQIHFNHNLPELGNLFITNFKDSLAYIFTGIKFMSVRKNEMLNDLIEIHMSEIMSLL